MNSRRMASTKFISEPRQVRVRFCFLFDCPYVREFHYSITSKGLTRTAKELDVVQVPGRITGDFGRIALLHHHCSVPVHHTHRSLPLKMPSLESSGGNLRL